MLTFKEYLTEIDAYGNPEDERAMRDRHRREKMRLKADQTETTSDDKRLDTVDQRADRQMATSGTPEQQHIARQRQLLRKKREEERMQQQAGAI